MSEGPVEIGYPGDKVSLLAENAVLRAKVEEQRHEIENLREHWACVECGKKPSDNSMYNAVCHSCHRCPECAEPMCTICGDGEGMRLRNRDLLAKVEELTRERSAACNLLAVLHRDGGHHARAFGFVQSCLDGQEVRHRLLERADQAEARLAKVAGVVAQWQGADSLTDCPACAVLDAALAAARGEEGK